MSFELRPLRPEDATAAATIHAEGQPDTFLTSLGPAFLRALYAQMAGSTHCFGYVAEERGEVIGVVVGTVDAGAVFKELILRRGFRLLVPVGAAILRRPALLPDVLRTAFYPGRRKGGPHPSLGEGGNPQASPLPISGEGELFFIGTRADRRGTGVGRALFQALAEEMRRRGMRAMGLTVDEGNEQAKRFYLRNGMCPAYVFTLYGRRMWWFVLPLAERDEGR